MDDEERELVRWLFASATVLIEDAHEVAAAGQSAGITDEDRAAAARRLRTAAQDITGIAEAVLIVTNPGGEQLRNRPESSR